ncbi:hypothetical protein BC938DRAFT_479436 [Jimgerdemannia flammicorona]|uniref:Uncharacterized protein n=1 Tax=Jimgerdemannia flammicorona TaxID=994334 RepID=A0A433QKX1_9FUNG|nr:hypothetical protein BC938DRAFT_479436 [Jimgerdemannia flammicorona]
MKGCTVYRPLSTSIRVARSRYLPCRALSVTRGRLQEIPRDRDDALGLLANLLEGHNRQVWLKKEGEKGRSGASVLDSDGDRAEGAFDPDPVAADGVFVGVSEALHRSIEHVLGEGGNHAGVLGGVAFEDLLPFLGLLWFLGGLRFYLVELEEDGEEDDEDQQVVEDLGHCGIVSRLGFGRGGRKIMMRTLARLLNDLVVCDPRAVQRSSSVVPRHTTELSEHRLDAILGSAIDEARVVKPFRSPPSPTYTMEQVGGRNEKKEENEDR